jgi:plasmid maintenance system antidote protein VapI
MRVYEKIRKYIRESGYRQRFIAEQGGYTEKNFSAMMTGRKKITIEDYQCICNVLGVSPELFLVNLKPNNQEDH